MLWENESLMYIHPDEKCKDVGICTGFTFLYASKSLNIQ